MSSYAVSGGRSNGNSGIRKEWLSIREASVMFSLSPSFLRGATERKKDPLPCLRIGQGQHPHRRFNIHELTERFGGKTTINKDSIHQEKIPIAAVTRVSSNSQGKGFQKGDPSDLSRQCLDVRTYIYDRWGKDNVTLTEYPSIGSGLNYERPEFIRLIEDVLSGKMAGGFLVARTFDRCCRYGIQLVKLCCKFGKCEMVFTEPNPSKELFEDMASEIIMLIGYYHAKTMGARARKTNTVRVDNKTVIEIKRLSDLGLPDTGIEDELWKNGYRSEHPENEKISCYVIKKVLKNKELLDKVCPKTMEKNSWEKFVKEHLIYDKVEDGEESRWRLTKMDLYHHYENFCLVNNLVKFSSRKIGDLTKDIPRRYTHSGHVALCGIRIRGDQ